jgi:hypothetical protein
MNHPETELNEFLVVGFAIIKLGRTWEHIGSKDRLGVSSELLNTLRQVDHGLLGFSAFD